MDYEESQLKKPSSERHPSLNGTAGLFPFKLQIYKKDISFQYKFVLFS